MFSNGFKKIAGIADTAKKVWHSAPHLDQAGLALLGGATAYHGYKAIKEKDTGNAAAAGMDLTGLGLLSRAVSKAKH